MLAGDLVQIRVNVVAFHIVAIAVVVDVFKQLLPGQILAMLDHLCQLGRIQFDVVLNLGLLYHVVNPLQVIRRTYELCREFAIIDAGTERSDLPKQTASAPANATPAKPIVTASASK